KAPGSQVTDAQRTVCTRLRHGQRRLRRFRGSSMLHFRRGFSPAGFGVTRGMRAGQVAGGIDEADVAERLRRVAQLPAGGRVVLLAEQSEIIAEAEKPLEQLVRLALPADA